MGGTSSTPASPQLSPDVRITGRVQGMQRGPCPESSLSSTAFKSDSNNCGSEYRDKRSAGSHKPESPCTKRTETPCPAAGDDENDDEDDDSECEEEDDDEDECDDDDEEDECEDEEEDEEDDCEESVEEEEEQESERQVYSPCRDPPAAESEEETSSDQSISRETPAFSPCRDPASETRDSQKENRCADTSPKKLDRKDKERSLQEKPSSAGLTPCREPGTGARTGSLVPALARPFSPCRDPRAAESEEETSSDQSTSRETTAFSPCRDPTPETRDSHKKNRCADTSPKKLEKKDKERSSPGDGLTPCREPETEAQTGGLWSALVRAFSPCRDPSVTESSPKPNDQSEGYNKLASPKCQPVLPKSDARKPVCTVKKPENARQSESQSKPEQSTDMKSCGAKEACKGKAVGKEKSVTPPEKENTENQKRACQEKKSEPRKRDEEALYGEKIKELQKGCAYLSRKELRRVCNKYQSYGCVKETLSDTLQEKTETTKIDKDVYALGYSNSEESSASSDYSGSISPCSSHIKCGINDEMVSLTQADKYSTRLRVQETAQMGGSRSLAATEYTTGSASSAEKAWYSGQEGLPGALHTLRGRNVQQEPTIDTSTVRKDSGDTATSTGRKSRWKSRSTSHPQYTITISRPRTEDGSCSSTREPSADENKSNSSSPCSLAVGLSEPSQSTRNGGVSGKRDYGDKTNSNNLCLEEQTDPDSTGSKTEAISVSSRVTAAEDTQPVVDDLWFECVEAELTLGAHAGNSGRFKDSFDLVDDFVQVPNLPLEFGAAIAGFDEAISLDDKEGSNINILGALGRFQRRNMCKDGLNSTRDVFLRYEASTASRLQRYDLAVSRADGNRLASRGFRCTERGLCGSHMLSNDARHVKSETCIETRLKPADLLQPSLAARNALPFRKGGRWSGENSNSNADSLISYKKKRSSKKLKQATPPTPPTPPAPPTPSTPKDELPVMKPVASKLAQDEIPTEIDLEELRASVIARGYRVFDFDLAIGLGLSRDEIKQLVDSTVKTPVEKITSLQRLEQQLFDIDIARDMGLTRNQAKVLVDKSSQITRSNSRIFDVNLAKQMGLNATDIDKLMRSSSPINRAEYMMVMGEAPFEPDLALSMGLSKEQVQQLIDSSLQVSRRNVKFAYTENQKREVEAETCGGHVTFDQNLAKIFGLTPKQIEKLAASSNQCYRSDPEAFNRFLAQEMGLTDAQINALAESSPQTAQANFENQLRHTKPLAFLDEKLAQQMGLSEDQIRRLAYNSANRMLGKGMFDPYLALQMGLSTKQIKQLADTFTLVNRDSRFVLNETLARSLGLSDEQINVLKNSSSLEGRTDFDPLIYMGQQVFDVTTASALGLHTREINQLLSSSLPKNLTQEMGQSYAPPNSGQRFPNYLNDRGYYTRGMKFSGQTRQPKSFSKQRASRLNSGILPPKYPSKRPVACQQPHAVGDGAGRKDQELRKKQLVLKLQASVSGGDKVNDVLNKLVEWNSILLVVIFLLLLLTSCPNAARALLPCPVPSTCQILHRYVISPLGIDQVWQDSPFAGNKIWDGELEDEPRLPPQGAVYTVLYRVGKAAGVAGMNVLTYVFHHILAPLPSLLVSVLSVLYTTVSCTAQTLIYLVFYACGSFLGVQVPRSLEALHHEGQVGVHSTPKTRSSAGSAVEDAWRLDSPSDETATQEHPYSSDKEGSPLQPFSPAQAELMTLDLQTLHQYGGFLFYVGFDPPKKGCNYSTVSSFFLWLLWSLPEECA